MKKAFNALLLSTAITATAQAEPVNLRETLAQEFGTAVQGATSIDHLQVEKKDGVLWIVEPDKSHVAHFKPSEREEAHSTFFKLNRSIGLEKFLLDTGGLAVRVEATPDRIDAGVEAAKNLAEQIEQNPKYIKAAEAAGVTPDVQVLAYSNEDADDLNFGIHFDGIISEKKYLGGSFSADQVVELYTSSLNTSDNITTKQACDIFPATQYINCPAP